MGGPTKMRPRFDGSGAMRTRGSAALAVLTCLAAAACGGERGPEGSPADGRPPAGAVQPGTSAPDTDVWLAALRHAADGSLEVSDEVNVTVRAGYDNQPAFLPDGSGFWYTLIDESGQADIWRYDHATRAVVQLTRTAPESEYSATPIPDGSGISVVRVEADSVQRLWRFSYDGAPLGVLIPELAPVGYHAWADARTVVAYVLGDPATLHVVDVERGADRQVAENVGRSIQPIPGTSLVSFTQRVPDGGTEIRRLDPDTGASERIAPSVAGGDFHAWTPDGVLLQADGGRLLAWDEADGTWTVVRDFSDRRLSLSRLAVSPDGAWLAFVATIG